MQVVMKVGNSKERSWEIGGKEKGKRWDFGSKAGDYLSHPYLSHFSLPFSFLPPPADLAMRSPSNFYLFFFFSL